MTTMTLANLARQQKSKVTSYLHHRAEGLALALMTWALGYQSVQRHIAVQLRNGGALCRALDEAAESAVQSTIEETVSQEIHSSIENAMSDLNADSISGLEDAIEETVNKAFDNISADNVEGLDEKIQEVISDNDLQAELLESVVENVMEVIVKKLGSK